MGNIFHRNVFNRIDNTSDNRYTYNNYCEYCGKIFILLSSLEKHKIASKEDELHKFKFNYEMAQLYQRYNK